MARLRFGTDSLGKEILELVHAAPAAAASPPSLLQDGNGHDAAVEENKPYKGDNTIVMMEWERPYMRALVDALGITGDSDVLEIGFGCGYSADRIQEFSPRSHTVVEPDPTVLDRLKGWAEGRPGVRVVEGFWQAVLPALGRYDAVFFDDFPLPGTPDSSDLRGPMSRWHAFIDLCVAHHLPVGGRITGYLARPIPLARPECEAAPLVAFPVDVPDNCPYFPYGEAYIPLIMRVERPGAGTGDGDGVGGIARGAGGDSRRYPLLSDASGDDAGLPRKRQKRLVLEALVRESLGLGADRM